MQGNTYNIYIAKFIYNLTDWQKAKKNNNAILQFNVTNTIDSSFFYYIDGMEEVKIMKSKLYSPLAFKKKKMNSCWGGENGFFLKKVGIEFRILVHSLDKK